MSIKDVVHSNQSSTVWQVEIHGLSGGDFSPQIFLKAGWQALNVGRAILREAAGFSCGPEDP
jgi:hypothetical protein